MGKLTKGNYTRKHFTDASNDIIKEVRDEITDIFETVYGQTNDKRFRSYMKEDPILTMLVLGDGDRLTYRVKNKGIEEYRSEEYGILLMQYIRGDVVQRKIAKTPGSPGHLNLVVTTTVGNTNKDIYAPMSLKGKAGIVSRLKRIEDKVRNSPEANKRIL